MRTIKILLILLLVITTVLFTYNVIFQKASGQKEGPVISCSQEIIDLSVSDDESVLLAGVTATDKQDGDLTGRVLVAGVSKLITDNTAKVTYLVFDSDNNMGSATRKIRYTDYQRPKFSVKEQLSFANSSSIQLAERVGAEDVIDGDLSESVRVSTLQDTDMTDVYSITVQVTNSMGDTARLDLPVIIQEANPARPVISLNEHLLYLGQGSTFDPRLYVASVMVGQEQESVLEVQIDNPVNTEEVGSYWVSYTYSANGVVGKAILTVVVQ